MRFLFIVGWFCVAAATTTDPCPQSEHPRLTPPTPDAIDVTIEAAVDEVGSGCTASVFHPIDVTIRPLGEIRRGETILARVELRSRSVLTDAHVRVVSTGGADLLSEADVAMGALSPQDVASTDVAVRVPEAGHRFLLQLVVEALDDDRRIRRGASWNLLPDGPGAPGEPILTPDGRKLVQYPARRVNR